MSLPPEWRMRLEAGSNDAMEPVRALLDVAAFPDDSICAISFNFWHRLAHALTSGFSQPEPLDEAEDQVRLGPFGCPWGRFSVPQGGFERPCLKSASKSGPC